MSSPRRDETENVREEVLRLLSSYTDGTLDEAGQERLAELVSADATAQEVCRRFAALTAALRRQARRDQAGEEPESWRPETGVNDGSASPGRGASEDVFASLPSPHFQRRLSHFWQPMTLVLLVGLLAAGVLVYKFSTQTAPLPVAQRLVAADSAAKVVGKTDAQWSGAFGPEGESLKPGQRLVLQRGLVEILFGKQARVIVEAPADFVITDSAACRLDGGKLTAHVPEAARGFKVHTPDGTVTDLGTEFGVYVRREAEGVRLEAEGQEEQQEKGSQQEAKQPAVTEVHVFKGQVDVTPAQLSTAPESRIQNPKSKIVSAGQAVTISENKVQTLPAADPFKFAIDKLQGKPRQVLLSDDFEMYELGNQAKAIGPWIVQGGTFRKGQGVAVIDPAATIAQLLAEPNISIPHASPGPANGQRVAKCVSSLDFPKDTYPLLAREVDCRQFARHCQVLVEFDLFAQGVWTEPSLAFAAEVGQGPGIALWQTSDTTAPKIEWQPHRWYRVRVSLDVADGAIRSARVERLLWAGTEGWVRDSSYTPPIPKVEWRVPPRYIVFGFPVPPTAQSGGHYWLDNIRVESISDQ